MVNDKKPVMEAIGLTKRFGAIEAISQINLAINAAECVGLIGDNGAGKSTLVKSLCGAYHPDAGQILYKDEEVIFNNPLEARLKGIEIIYQTLALAPNLDVAGNFFIGREKVHRIPFLPWRLSPLNQRKMELEAAEYLASIQVSLPAISGINVINMSGGQRQAIAIARAAAWATEVLFMDEPTAALGVKQSEAVLNLVKVLVDRGLAVVLITHNLPSILKVCDRIIVLRHGRLVADIPREEATEHKLVSLIVGFDERLNGSLQARQ
jgi:ABC-type sugar transport system ATPase subunit